MQKPGNLPMAEQLKTTPQTHNLFIVRQFGNYSLRTKLIIAFVLVTLVSVGTMTFIINRVIQTELTRTVGANLKVVANSQASVIGDLMVTQVDILSALSVRKTVIDKVKLSNGSYTGDSAAIQAGIDQLDQQWRAADAANNDADPLVQSRLNSLLALELRGLRDLAPDHVEIFVTDQYGANVAATNRTSDYYQADEEWWQVAYNNGQGAVYIGQPEFDESSGVTALNIAVPLYGDNTTGTVVGVLRSTFHITVLTNILTTAAQFGQTSDAEILLPSSEVIKSKGDIGPVDPNTLAQLEASKDTTYAQVVFEEKPRLVSQAPVSTHDPESQPIIANLGWRLIIDQDSAEALRPVDTTVQTGLLTGLGVVFLAGLLAVGVAQILVRPITRLTIAASQIAAGNLEIQVPIRTTDEIGQLARAFNNMTSQLRQLIDSLEERVTSRTRRLELVATLSERLSAILELEKLLQELVNQIKDSFGYYHAHIYLLNDQQEKLVLAEGTGVAGVEMKAKGHSIQLDAPTSLVARAARTGEIVRVDNVREAKNWLPNPLLPDTYSEMAVPISLEGQIIGVLDVQQDKMAGLDDGDANLLRSLANQVGVAIRNARLFTEVETALNEAREIQRGYTAQSWDRTRVTRKSVGRVQISLGESTTLGEGMIASAQQQVLSHQKPTVVALNGSQDDPATQHALVAPVMLRDVMIGDLQLHGIEPDRAWTKGELAMINGVIDQVAQIAENLRLFEETRERATQEQTIREITNKLRATSNLDALLETATRELGQHLGVRHTVLELGIEAGQNGKEGG
jgi:GAF domain-containing protein/HAMP domain-containing protein